MYCMSSTLNFGNDHETRHYQGEPPKKQGLRTRCVASLCRFARPDVCIRGGSPFERGPPSVSSLHNGTFRKSGAIMSQMASDTRSLGKSSAQTPNLKNKQAVFDVKGIPTVHLEANDVLQGSVLSLPALTFVQ